MPEIETLTITAPYLPVACALGEGPFYEEDTDVLRFVDIIRKEVHSVSLAAGPASHKVVVLEDSVGSVVTLGIGVHAGSLARLSMGN